MAKAAEVNGRKVKVLVLSSLAQNTGCWLRAQYLANSLKGADVEIITPMKKSLPLMMDVLLSIPLNVYKIFSRSADVVIAIKPFPNATIPMALKRFLAGSRMIVDIDDLDSGYRRGILSRLNAAIQKPFPKYFDLVTYHNSLLRDYIKKEFEVREEKLYKLDQGVDLKIFDYKKFDRKLRRRFAQDGEKIILFMGHLNIASDLDDILRAMKLVQEKAKAVFIVAGGGPEEANFRNLARKIGVKAVFTGYVKNKEISSYVGISDICLVYYKDKPVNYYRCSMKLRECMAMGKKVVCDDVGELKDFRKYTYQTRADIEEFSNKIIEVLKSGGDGREIRARKFVEGNLDWNSLGRKFEERIGSMTGYN